MASQPRSATGCIAIFGLIWCLGVGLFDFAIFPGLWKQIRAGSYQRAEATVLESRVIESKGDDSTSYRPYFRYQYRVDGITQVSDRYRYAMPMSGGPGPAHAAVEAQPVGSKLEVWYDPGSPAESVVDKQLSGLDLFLPMFMTPFNIIGFGLLLAPLWGRRSPGPGGVPVVREGLGWRARLQYSHPLLSVLGSLGALTFAGVFVVGFGTMMHPGLLIMQAAWAFILATSIWAGYKTAVSNRVGSGDLRIEPGRLEFKSGSQRISCGFSEVSEVAVRREEKRDSEGDISYAYEVDVHLQSGESHSLKVWNDESQARDFADWLKGHLQGACCMS